MQECVREGPVITLAAKTSAIIIANPTSGSYLAQAPQMVETLAYLREQGWDVVLKLTQEAGDARRFAREAVQQQLQAVVVAGGDGTINEVIQELVGSETALGILPGGTVNVWAREVGIPLDQSGARNVLAHGQIRSIDLGKIKEHYFLLMVGIGLDGEITLAVEKKPAKRLGVLGYLLVGTWLGLGYRGFRLHVKIDGRSIRTSALQVIIGNTQLYGGAIKYTWQARCDDGLLDLCIVRKQNVFGRILVLLDFLLGREQRRQWVRYERGREISIRTRYPVALQIDGDPLGYTSAGNPSTICTIVPGALKVIVPQVLPPAIFS